MKPEFWHQRWEEGRIGFHEPEANPMLVKHFERLSLVNGSRVLVPLCGKTLDIGWLLSKGYRVAGVELSEIAVKQLFAELGVEPQITDLAGLRLYRGDGLDVFAGDIFDLTREVLGPVDAVYDRAALVALPEAMRRRYAAHVAALTGRALQLLLCFEYDPRLLDGPPFSISADEVRACYDAAYAISLLDRFDMPGGLKGKCAAEESVWLLKPQSPLD